MKIYVIKKNHDECPFMCKELWSSCKDNYAWNPSTCDCECDKACWIGK